MRTACGQILTHVVVQATGRRSGTAGRCGAMNYFAQRLQHETDADDVGSALLDGTADFTPDRRPLARRLRRRPPPGRDQPPAQRWKN